MLKNALVRIYIELTLTLLFNRLNAIKVLFIVGSRYLMHEQIEPYCKVLMIFASQINVSCFKDV